MGHALQHERVYSKLQQRLDCDVTGAPASPTFIQILKLLYAPEEAEIASAAAVRAYPAESAGATVRDPDGRARCEADPDGRARRGDRS